jgi:hypothetical protein
LAQLGRTLNRLGQQRQAFFDVQDDAHQQTLLATNKQIAEQVTTLESMPRFGIYTEVDEFSLGGAQQPDEIGEVGIASLQSLTNRYEKEIANTISLQQQVAESRDLLNQQIRSLQNILDAAGEQITEIKASITSQVRWVMLFVVLIIVSAVGMQAWLQTQTLAYLLGLERFFRWHAQRQLQAAAGYRCPL